MTPYQIGKAIRKARGQRSIREVAGAAGLHRDQVTGIEQATKAYTVLSLLALCKVVGLRLVFQAKGSEAHSSNGSTGSDDVRG
jgi:transcriptional regulator with XRE-family HTH domain